jgi:hypothetical protein
MSEPGTGAPQPTKPEEEVHRIDIGERGGKGPDGQPQVSNARLFVQLMVFDCPPGARPDGVIQALQGELGQRGVKSVLYEDTNAPAGIGVLSYDQDPSVFVRKVRPAVNAVGPLAQRLDHNMLGRSYSIGYEPDLKHALIDRPISVMQNTEWPWAVWYPLRRSGAFAKLDAREQAGILREHSIIGRAYGAQDLAHDVRLACHGLDARDNEFVVGLVGRDLHPLSHVVQSMRKTRQTSEFIAQMGPFFVGYAAART